MKRRVLCLLTAICLILTLFPNLACAKRVELIGGAVSRTSATEAVVRFQTSMSGKCYYVVDERSVISSDEVLSGEYAFDVEENSFVCLEIDTDLMSSGPKYVHIVVWDDTDDYVSNTLHIFMPYDVYYFEDFEACIVETALSSTRDGITNAEPLLYTKYNGGDQSRQLVKRGTGGNFLDTTGTYATGLDIRSTFPFSVTSGHVVLEADITNVVFGSSFYGAGLILGSGDSDERAISIAIQKNSHKFVSQAVSGGDRRTYDGSMCEIDKKNHLRIEVDLTNKNYNYYVDGVKANNTPISYDSQELEWFGMYNGDGNACFDNIKFYTTDSLDYEISFDANDGTGEMDTLSSRDDQWDFVLPTCEFVPPVGMHFKEWAVGNADSIVRKGPDDIYEVTKDTIVYAVWEADSYTVAYDANGGTGSMEDALATHGTALELPSCTFTAPENMHFKEWAIGSADSTTRAAAEGDFFFTEDTTVYAVWENDPEESGPIEYTIADEQESEWTKGGTSGFAFTTDGDYSALTGIFVDGVAVTADNYTLNSDNTVLTLNAAYLDTLSAGQHTIRVEFLDGFAEREITTKNDVPEEPETGDVSQT